MSLLHITKLANVASIMVDGLKAATPADMPGEPRGVYCFLDKDAMENALGNWMGDRLGGELAVLSIEATGLPVIPGADFEVILGCDVPVGRILGWAAL